MKASTLTVFGCLTCVFFLGCGNEHAEGLLDPSLGQQTENLMVNQAAKWAYITGFNGIPVCWDQSYSLPSLERGWIKDQVIKQFESSLKIHFVGWADCYNDTQPGLHVGANIVPGSRALDRGSRLSGKKNGVQLDYQFLSANTWCAANETIRQQCVRNVAGHEFGHALGAYHEQERADRWDECVRWGSGYFSNWADNSNIVPLSATATYAPPTSSFDVQSIMDYCNNAAFTDNGTNFGAIYNLAENNNGILSAGDQAGFSWFYGPDKFLLHQTTAKPKSDAYSLMTTSSSLSTQARTAADLMIIQLGGTNAEIHSLTQSSNYQTWSQHISTAISGQLLDRRTYRLTLGYKDNDNAADLFYVYANRSTNRYEVHVLSASSRYQTYITHTSLQKSVEEYFNIALADYNGDGVDDLYLLSISNTPIGDVVNLNIFNGASNYTSSLFSKSYTDGTISSNLINDCKWIAGRFNSGAVPDLTCFLVGNTGTKTIEIHNLLGSAQYGGWNVHAASQMASASGDVSDFSYVSSASRCSSQNTPGCAGNFVYIKKDGATGTELHIGDATLYWP